MRVVLESGTMTLTSTLLTLSLVLSVVQTSKPLLFHPLVWLIPAAVALAVVVQLLFVVLFWLSSASGRPEATAAAADRVGLTHFADFVIVHVSAVSTFGVALVVLLSILGVTAASWLRETLLPLLRRVPALYFDETGAPRDRPPMDLRKPRQAQ